MIKLLKRSVAAVIGLSLMVAAGANAANATSLQQIEKRGTINVGMLVDFPPYGIMNSQNKPDGYDADVAKLLAKYLKVRLNLVPVTGPNRIPYLLSGQVDVLVASLDITKERAERVNFSEGYADDSIAIYGDRALRIMHPADLSGHSIGVARASTQDTAVTSLAPKGTDIRRFDDDASVIQALMSGQVELVGVSNVVMAELGPAFGGRFDKKFDLNNSLMGIAVSPGSSALLEKVNAFLEKVKADDTLDAVHEKWLREPLPDYVKNGK
jgi:polar amino acid transport system substrate-binding protein